MDFTKLNRIRRGYTTSRILQVAVKLGVFDSIANEGKTVGEMADTLNTEPRATELLLNSLVALELLQKKAGKFCNTNTSLTYLVKNSQNYFGGLILFEESLWQMWGKLEESVRTGEPAEKPDMFQQSEEDTERFIRAMHSLVRARGDAEVLCKMLDLKEKKFLIDIGSGPGTYPIEFLKKYPHLEITVFDLPGTVRVTKKILSEEGISNAVNIVVGDYKSDPIPQGFDLALLSNIIHSEREDTNRKLVENIYHALNPGGKIVIKDHILDQTLTTPSVGAVFSLQMLLATEGRDYSFEEISTWLESAGFRHIEWIDLPRRLESSLATGIK